VRALLGQQITVVGARNLGARLAARLGAPLDEAWREDGLARAFPSAAALAALDPATLPMPGARARALTTLAAEALAEPELFGAYPSLEAAIARLKRLKGIGDWTAHYIALRGLKHPDAFPAGDLGLMRALAAPDGTRPSAAALLARAEGWRPWRAYAAQHLWTADAAITFAQIT
jgi:AraC family transcriptional regulator of adaptative response / DNA-3-methyladenine glycosylase II